MKKDYRYLLSETAIINDIIFGWGVEYAWNLSEENKLSQTGISSKIINFPQKILTRIIMLQTVSNFIKENMLSQFKKKKMGS